MAQRTGECPLCDGPTEVIGDEPSVGVARVQCRRCGIYRITYIAVGLLSSNRGRGVDERYRLSGLARQRTVQVDSPPLIHEENYEELAAEAPTGPLEKADVLLLNVAATMERERVLAGIVLTGDQDYPLGFCRDAAEFDFLMRQLGEQGLILTREPYNRSVTLEGWKHIRELRHSSRGSNQGFVAMRFNDEMQAMYDAAIAPAIRDAGYEPQQAGRIEHVKDINDVILAEIKKSRFVVADFTGQRNGVYYEAGYARGLGLTVIWTCKDDDKDNLHFDTSHYNHIFWKTPEDLYRDLKARIEVVVG